MHRKILKLRLFRLVDDYCGIYSEIYGIKIEIKHSKHNTNFTKRKSSQNETTPIHWKLI